MPRRGLSPDVALGVHLDAICSRNRYTSTPDPVIDELLRVGGHQPDLLAREVGIWAGYFDGRDTHTLCAALLERIPGAAGWAPVGRERAGRVPH